MEKLRESRLFTTSRFHIGEIRLLFDGIFPKPSFDRSLPDNRCGNDEKKDDEAFELGNHKTPGKYCRLDDETVLQV